MTGSIARLPLGLGKCRGPNARQPTPEPRERRHDAAQGQLSDHHNLPLSHQATGVGYPVLSARIVSGP
jgi:hypothetical protein